MEDRTQVDIDALRATVNAIFDFIEHEVGRESVELPANLYWTVPDGALYVMSVMPQQLDCGSLADDYEFVKAAHADREQAIPLVLVHLAPLLYALGKAVPSFKDNERCVQDKGPSSD